MKTPKKGPISDEMRARVKADRLKQLEALAAAEVEAELDAQAEEAIKEEIKTKMRRKKDPALRMKSIRIDLPDSAPYICIDGQHGKTYYPNVTYSVDADTYDTLKEIMWRSWREDASRRGEINSNEYRRTLNRQISGSGMVIDDA
jgi:hypothetical protein